MLRTCYALTGALLLITVCIGCSNSDIETASVKGKVTMDDKPLANASVVFIPENGRPAGASTDDEGNYVLTFSGDRQGAMLGKNIVKISTLSDPSETEAGEIIPGTPETVPIQYNAETTLEFMVEQKENIANFDLSSEGEIADHEGES